MCPSFAPVVQLLRVSLPSPEEQLFCCSTRPILGSHALRLFSAAMDYTFAPHDPQLALSTEAASMSTYLSQVTCGVITAVCVTDAVISVSRVTFWASRALF